MPRFFVADCIRRSSPLQRAKAEAGEIRPTQSGRGGFVLSHDMAPRRMTRRTLGGFLPNMFFLTPHENHHYNLKSKMPAGGTLISKTEGGGFVPHKAEGGGFEPTIRFPEYRISSAAH